jgi:hypothetical protein
VPADEGATSSAAPALSMRMSTSVSSLVEADDGTLIDADWQSTPVVAPSSSSSASSAATLTTSITTSAVSTTAPDLTARQSLRVAVLRLVERLGRQSMSAGEFLLLLTPLREAKHSPGQCAGLSLSSADVVCRVAVLCWSTACHTSSTVVSDRVRRVSRNTNARYDVTTTCCVSW